MPKKKFAPGCLMHPGAAILKASKIGWLKVQLGIKSIEMVYFLKNASIFV
jgi:hypothetical protein